MLNFQVNQILELACNNYVNLKQFLHVRKSEIMQIFIKVKNGTKINAGKR